MKSHHLSNVTFAKITKIESLSHHLLDYANYYLNPYCFNIVFQYKHHILSNIRYPSQVRSFFICFYFVLNLTTKVRTFTYDWASPTGKSSSNVRRTILLRFVWLQRTLRGPWGSRSFATSLETRYSFSFFTRTRTLA